MHNYISSILSLIGILKDACHIYMDSFNGMYHNATCLNTYSWNACLNKLQCIDKQVKNLYRIACTGYTWCVHVHVGWVCWPCWHVNTVCVCVYVDHGGLLTVLTCQHCACLCARRSRGYVDRVDMSTLCAFMCTSIAGTCWPCWHVNSHSVCLCANLSRGYVDHVDMSTLE